MYSWMFADKYFSFNTNNTFQMPEQNGNYRAYLTQKLSFAFWDRTLSGTTLW
jgi:hypothetical protein